ncbi:MAG: hypothetical protein WEA36_07295 [Balneolaceae bacterium]
MRIRVYTLFCFVSLMTGLLQPALPLIEYYTFQESIIELFCINKDKPEMHCDGACYLRSQIKKMQEDPSSVPDTLLALDKSPNFCLYHTFFPFYPSRPYLVDVVADNGSSSTFADDLFRPPRG